MASASHLGTGAFFQCGRGGGDALAAAGGSNGAAAIGGAAVAMGGAVIAAGLLVGLFAQIEARMIEIQKAIVAAHQTAVVAAGLQPEPSIITLRD